MIHTRCAGQLVFSAPRIAALTYHVVKQLGAGSELNTEVPLARASFEAETPHRALACLVKTNAQQGEGVYKSVVSEMQYRHSLDISDVRCLQKRCC
eukprot:3607014-Amphidinium_carterae.1